MPQDNDLSSVKRAVQVRDALIKVIQEYGYEGFMDDDFIEGLDYEPENYPVFLAEQVRQVPDVARRLEHPAIGRMP